jgi:hypothetical protein
MNVLVEVHLSVSQQKKYRRENAEHHESNLSFNRCTQAFSQQRLLLSTHPTTTMACQSNISDTTRSIPALERNDPVKANSFAVERDNFSSSPRMVQLIFFERSH